MEKGVTGAIIIDSQRTYHKLNKTSDGIHIKRIKVLKWCKFIEIIKSNNTVMDFFSTALTLPLLWKPELRQSTLIMLSCTCFSQPIYCKIEKLIIWNASLPLNSEIVWIKLAYTPLRFQGTVGAEQEMRLSSLGHQTLGRKRTGELRRLQTKLVVSPTALFFLKLAMPCGTAGKFSSLSCW